MRRVSKDEAMLGPHDFPGDAKHPIFQQGPNVSTQSALLATPGARLIGVYVSLSSVYPDLPLFGCGRHAILVSAGNQKSKITKTSCSSHDLEGHHV